jgi:DNA-binding NarL/FixJ family response regulator
MARISVLVVDDHQVFADALRARLLIEDDLGPIAVAYSSAQALACLNRSSFDVTILDYGLGDESGSELASTLMRSEAATCVIMLSAVDSLDAVVDSLIAGVRGWLPKMIDTKHLVNAIRGVQAGEMWIDRALLGQAMPALLHRVLTPPTDPLGVLTPREREVLDGLINGLSRAEIGIKLNVSSNTVRTHTQNLISKLGVHSALEAVTLALRSGYRPS